MAWTSGIDYSYNDGYAPKAYDFLDDTLDRGGYSFSQPIQSYNSSGQLISSAGATPSGANYAAAGGAGLVGGYENASTDTGGSVLSGAASGAAAGAAFGPWGAVIGGVVGAIGGFFGSKSKKKQAKQQFEQQKELAVAQIQEQEKNYQLHQQQLKDAYKPYEQYANQGYQFKNGLLAGTGNNFPSFNQQAPAQQSGGLLQSSDPNQLAQMYAQRNQQDQASALGMYQGLLHG